MIRISVVVSIYNIETYIEDCIKSVLCQSFTDFELLLIDDGSNDKSGIICDVYAEKDNRIRVIHQTNQSLSAARNTGINNSIFEYIYFVDGDDILHKNALQSFIDILNKFPNVDFILGRMSCFHDNVSDSEPYSYCVENDLVINKSGQEAFVKVVNTLGLMMMGIRGLYRRDFIIENDLFFIPRLNSQDQEWTVRSFIKANRIASNTYPYYYFRLGRKGSVTNTSNIKRAYDMIRIYKGWVDLLDDETLLRRFRDALKKEIGRRYLSLIVEMSIKLNRTKLDEFASEINRTKGLLKYANSKKYKNVIALLKILGVKNTIMFIHYISKFKGYARKIGKYK